MAADGFFDDRFVDAPAGDTLKELTLGSKLVLPSASLVFFSLFFTWQHVELDFGRTGTVPQPLDGWDFVGLLIGLVAVALFSVVLIVRASNVEASPDVDWDLVVLVLAGTLLGLVALKNLTDSESAWASYTAIVLAAIAVVGAYLDWSRWAMRRQPLRRRRRSRFRR